MKNLIIPQDKSVFEIIELLNPEICQFFAQINLIREIELNEELSFCLGVEEGKQIIRREFKKSEDFLKRPSNKIISAFLIRKPKDLLSHLGEFKSSVFSDLALIENEAFNEIGPFLETFTTISISLSDSNQDSDFVEQTSELSSLLQSEAFSTMIDTFFPDAEIKEEYANLIKPFSENTNGQEELVKRSTYMILRIFYEKKFLEYLKETIRILDDQPSNSREIIKIEWLGTQKELAELFVELERKKWINEINANTIKAIFTRSNSIQQVLKRGDVRNSTSFGYDQIYTTTYKSKFDTIRTNHKSSR